MFIFLFCFYLGPYIRKDPEVLKSIDSSLSSGKSPDQVYIEINKENCYPGKFVNQKSIYNRNTNLKKTLSIASEAERFVQTIQNNQFIRKVSFLKDRLMTLNYSDFMISDIVRFCVDGNAILCIDTTFELADGYWLTDTSYENLALLDQFGNHPHFPGPSMWHFRKDQGDYRSFGTSLIEIDPILHGIKKIGHDLDRATANGIRDAFQQSTSLWCTQHIQGRDKEKLRELGVSEQNIKRVMCDIYGSQTGN